MCYNADDSLIYYSLKAMYVLYNPFVGLTSGVITEPRNNNMIPRKIHTNSRHVLGLELLGCIVTRLQSEHEPTRAHPCTQACTYQLLGVLLYSGRRRLWTGGLYWETDLTIIQYWAGAREYPKVRGWFASESSIYRSLVAGPWHSDHRGSVVVMCTRHMIEWGRCWLPHRPTNSSKVMSIRRRRRLLFVPCNQQRHLTIIRVIASDKVCEEERRI